MKAYFDTAVVVAAAIEDHPHHPQAAVALKSVHEKRIAGCSSAHGLAELYAVLTRAPFTPPIDPSEAWQIIAENILPHFEIISLTAKEYRETISECAKEGCTGGKVYDALHLRAAQKRGLR